MKLVFFLLIFSTPLLSQNPNNHKFNFGGHYLFATDYTIQKPEGEDSFKSLLAGYSPSFEIQINFPFSKIFQFETGYRFKEHWLTYRSTELPYGSANWIETTHSIPLRIGAISKLGRSGILERFSFGLSGGFLLDIMQQSNSVNGYQLQIQTTSGRYILIDDYNPDEVNQVKAAVSFNGQCQLSHRILKFMDIYVGYGYTQGTKTLAKGSYIIYSPIGTNTGTMRGSMTTKGSYRYGILGLRFTLLNKTKDSLNSDTK